MNVERMNAVARRLRDDLVATNLPELIAQLADSLQNSINTPQDNQIPTTIANLRTQIEGALRSSDVNRFSPVESQVLDEWGVSAILGAELLDRIETTFNQNQVTLVTAMQEVRSMVQPLTDLAQNLNAFLTATEFFGIGAEELPGGEFEVDVLIPRHAVGNELVELGKEFVQLSEMLLPFVELSTGSRPPIEVRSIGSSDFTVFLHSAPAAAACVSIAVERVLTIYEKLLNIQALKAAASKLDLADTGNTIDQLLEAHASDAMEIGIIEIAKDLIDRFVTERTDEHRRNELEISVKRSLTMMATRIDDGYNISVRTGPLPPAGEDSEDETEDESGVRSLAEEVSSREQALGYMNRSGVPILSLPEPSEEVGGEDT